MARPSFCSRSRLKIEAELIVLPKPDTECFQLSSRQLHSNMHSTRPQCSTPNKKLCNYWQCLDNQSINNMIFCKSSTSLLIILLQYCTPYKNTEIQRILLYSVSPGCTVLLKHMEAITASQFTHKPKFQTLHLTASQGDSKIFFRGCTSTDINVINLGHYPFTRRHIHWHNLIIFSINKHIERLMRYTIIH